MVDVAETMKTTDISLLKSHLQEIDLDYVGSIIMPHVLPHKFCRTGQNRLAWALGRISILGVMPQACSA